MTCPTEELEALALGELDGDALARARAHVASCATCQEELALLREERARFLRRRRQEPSADALWRGVERRIAPAARRPRLHALALAVTAAAAALVLSLSVRPGPVSLRADAGTRPLEARRVEERADRAEGALDRAETDLGRAIAMLELQYLRRRPGLDPVLGQTLDATLAKGRAGLPWPPGARGGSIEERAVVLDGYTGYLRSLQSVVIELPEDAP